jgi:hypothetical protein
MTEMYQKISLIPAQRLTGFAEAGVFDREIIFSAHSAPPQ